jgi:hypothetical protein
VPGLSSVLTAPSVAEPAYEKGLQDTVKNYVTGGHYANFDKISGIGCQQYALSNVAL